MNQQFSRREELLPTTSSNYNSALIMGSCEFLDPTTCLQDRKCRDIRGINISIITSLHKTNCELS